MIDDKTNKKLSRKLSYRPIIGLDRQIFISNEKRFPPWRVRYPVEDRFLETNMLQTLSLDIFLIQEFYARKKRYEWL